jgi:hypothetical protein
VLAGLHRFYGPHHLDFITFSCYHRMPWLDSSHPRDRFLTILEQIREPVRIKKAGEEFSFTTW